MPTAANNYLEDHAILLCDTFYRLTGSRLLALPERELGKALFLAPFAVVSHDTAADPVFNYANRTALRLFEMSWKQFTSMPSRLSAEQPGREERAKLLAEVSAKGFIDNYTGIRVASSGRRFFIRNATVWNLHQQALACGQAAMFSDWQPIP